MEAHPTKSPFKFLDSYNKGDRAIFFGRDTEIEELYDRVFETNLVLLYGESGAGKTSLINCGLAGQFAETDWLPLNIRRNGNLLHSLDKALAEKAIKPFEEGLALRKKVRSLYLDYYQPIFLIFDQFEELFIQGDLEEAIQFFENISELIQSELQCKVILSMRGDYLDKLSKYELIIPSLFDNRLYLERMSSRNIEEVIIRTAEAFGIELEEDTRIAQAIIQKIRDSKEAVELANLQIYLDKLYRNDLERRNGHERPLRFDLALIETTKELEDVLSAFLDEQLEILEKELRDLDIKKPGIPLSLLFMLVTQRATKQSLPLDQLKKKMQRQWHIEARTVDYCIRRFNELRIIRILATE